MVRHEVRLHPPSALLCLLTVVLGLHIDLEQRTGSGIGSVWDKDTYSGWGTYDKEYYESFHLKMDEGYRGGWRWYLGRPGQNCSQVCLSSSFPVYRPDRKGVCSPRGMRDLLFTKKYRDYLRDDGKHFDDTLPYFQGPKAFRQALKYADPDIHKECKGKWSETYCDSRAPFVVVKIVNDTEVVDRCVASKLKQLYCDGEKEYPPFEKPISDIYCVPPQEGVRRLCPCLFTRNDEDSVDTCAHHMFTLQENQNCSDECCRSYNDVFCPVFRCSCESLNCDGKTSCAECE